MITLRDYGSMLTHEFPNPDDVRETLQPGEIAHIKDKATDSTYVLTKDMKCWTYMFGYTSPSWLCNYPTSSLVAELRNREIVNTMEIAGYTVLAVPD